MSGQDLRFTVDVNTFCANAFRNPPESCVPVYAWIWNGMVTRDETDKQLDEMQRMGIRSFYIIPEPKTFRPTVMPTMLEPEYLTAAYFDEFRYTIDKAKEMGMTAWIYDEGGWPSGGACCRVLYQRPDLARCTMESRNVTVHSGEVYRKPDDAYAVFSVDGAGDNVNYTILSGEFAPDADTEVVEYYSKRHFFESPEGIDFPDLTRKDSGLVFLEITHEQYKQRMSDLFGAPLKAVFTDEPTGPRPFPFQKEIVDEFESKYGYSILPYLPVLDGKIDINKDNQQVVLDWYNLCSNLFCENFLMSQKRWSNDNDMLFVGHFGGEDIPTGCVRSGHYHTMRALRCLDVPGVDAIWRQIFPIEKQKMAGVTVGDNKFFPRLASSAAAQTGGRHSLTESNGVYGQGMTFDEMRFVYTFQAIRGINVYNMFAVPYARELFLVCGEMPNMVEASACYADMPTFNRYLERLSYLTSLGRRKADIGLYIPMNDFWLAPYRQAASDSYEKAGFELEQSQLYFDIVDDDVLALANAEMLTKGEIQLGEASYSTIVIPTCHVLPQKSIQTLKAFMEGGGTVYVVSPTTEDGQQYDAQTLEGAVFVENCCGLMPQILNCTGDVAGIRMQERQIDNGRLYLISNEALHESVIDVAVDPAARWYILNPTDGNVIAACVEDGKIKLTLECGELVGLLQTTESFEKTTVDDNAVYMQEVNLQTAQQLEGPYSFRRTTQFHIGERTLETKVWDEAPKEVCLGDWRCVAGEEYSGSAIYTTTFKTESASQEQILDLGTVKYTCEVFLNKHSLGVRVMPPYRYMLPAELLQENNLLEIRVSNTAANEYLNTKMLDTWQPWQLGYYWGREKEFMPDSLPSGLFGPVRIMSIK